ncbi:family 43 glycosylhydrolase [Pedobacter sp. Leaf170]|uniref:family 43 glycosylhydrolase n=1 Tax=Pedobacter sp. Leaf170 TaxID=2876558 RepID=UPI001E642E7A|nr:family 43 glycosylhydrolase [Pedobacter sp. Leaf170]
MNKLYKAIAIFILFCQTINAQQFKKPIIPGYFADPTVVKSNGKYFIYATIDPWGGEELAVFETKDFINFKRHKLNWPTKAMCTSPTSNNSMVWAPSVVKGRDNKFYMYVSVGSEVWAGMSESPLGPWKNMLPNNKPLVSAKDFPNVHNIDADCFLDDNGQAYLYWGSGFNWINGKCMAVKLKKDMHSFDGVPQDVTPPGYFEGPHMIKRNNQYMLMFSEGKAIDETYRVGYAIGKSPFGPFVKGKNSPILSTIPNSKTIGPGHHTVFTMNKQDFILYHRIVPQKEKYVLRELCIDSLIYDSEGNFKKIFPR